MQSNFSTFNAPQFQRLAPDQTDKLYWACLEVLERTGVRLYDQEALDLLRRAGINVNRIRIICESKD